MSRKVLFLVVWATKTKGGAVEAYLERAGLGGKDKGGVGLGNDTQTAVETDLECARLVDEDDRDDGRHGRSNTTAEGRR